MDPQEDFWHSLENVNYEQTQQDLDRIQREKTLKQQEIVKKFSTEVDNLYLLIRKIHDKQINTCYPLEWFQDQQYIKEQGLICPLCDGVCRIAVQGADGKIYGIDCLINMIDGRQIISFKDSILKPLKEKNNQSYSEFIIDSRARNQIKKLIASCQFCKDANIQLSNLHNHIQKDCKDCKIKCQQCDQLILRCDDLEHNIVCPKKLEKCRFGCHIVSNLDDLFVHYINKHKDAMLRNLQNYQIIEGTRLVYDKQLPLKPVNQYNKFEIIELQNKNLVVCVNCQHQVSRYAWYDSIQDRHVCLYCGCRNQKIKCTCGKLLVEETSSQNRYMCKLCCQDRVIAFQCQEPYYCNNLLCRDCRSIILN